MGTFRHMARRIRENRVISIAEKPIHSSELMSSSITSTCVPESKTSSSEATRSNMGRKESFPEPSER